MTSRMIERTCTIDGCDSHAGTSGWCTYHYRRAWRTGDPLGKIPRKPAQRCTVDGCDHVLHGKGYCLNHYARWRRGWSDPHTVPVTSGPLSPRWVPKDRLDYDAMHERIKGIRGKAREFQCVDCGERADEWAYRHTDPEPRISEHGCEFTDDVMAYEPMCRRCHRRYDAQVRELEQRRVETA